MIRLVVAAYAYEYRAEEVLDTLTRLGREDLADLDDAWYVSRGSDGRVRLHQPIDLPVLGDATGARRDALLGAACLEPLLGGRAGGVRAGLVLGAAFVDEQFLIEFGRTLEPESSAILALVRDAGADRLLAELVLYGGTVMQTAVASPA
jgi:uncharacterized membrane protein